MNEPIRILQCIPGNMSYGGIETFIMNIYRNMDRNKVQFDFLIHGKGGNCFENEVNQLGGVVYRVPSIKHYFQYCKQMKKILNQNANKYKAIHIHCGYAISYFDARLAKKYKIHNIIIHSHSSDTDVNKRKIVQQLLKSKITKIATIKLACSKEAQKWMFSEDTNQDNECEIVTNGIYVDKYRWNEKIRQKIRKELKIEDKFVVGHVGRLSSAKNHIFLLEVFKEILEKEENAILLLLGDGELRNKIEEKVQEFKIEKKVIFLGNRENVNDFLQAMDVFVFPSLFEGFGLAALEAQVTGLRCFLSDIIAENVNVTDLVKFISLEEKPKQWAEIIWNNKNYERENKVDIVKDKKYDIIDTTNKMEKIYLQMN